MEKTFAKLIGAVAVLTSLDAAQAAQAPVPSEALRAQSYADLLEPMPNALETLIALDGQMQDRLTESVQVAQWHDHHHHHHHMYRRVLPRVVFPGRWRHHHHTIITTITTIGIARIPIASGATGIRRPTTPISSSLDLALAARRMFR